jgi:hypothetical protein
MEHDGIGKSPVFLETWFHFYMFHFKWPAVSGVARSQDGRPAAVFYPLRHPCHTPLSLCVSFSPHNVTKEAIPGNYGNYGRRSKVFLAKDGDMDKVTTTVRLRPVRQKLFVLLFTMLEITVIN